VTARFPSIHLGAPGEEISKKDLFAVAQRFKYFNQARLRSAQEFLQPRQQDFLTLLPLLFHINHPLLPGFVSLDTPAGIPDYTPSNSAIDTAKQFSKGFAYKRKALRNYPIEGIFLMGSVGSMAFSKDSDIDIWLCYQPGMSGEELVELRRKADEVEKWAASLKLEVHVFLVDRQQFRRGENTPISAESSGETQHYLLLEEFYRTSIYIAGRIPVWWLVPPNQQHNYAEYVTHLLENRFISEADVIDFGGLQEMPVSEFVSATLWHLYKSLTSPHKALLKLFLMESYASEFPSPQWLCLTMKKAIYRGEFSVDSLDPYLLIYSKVEEYLQKIRAVERLDLARESFYIKIMGSSSTALDAKAKLLHENFLSITAQRWQWSDDLLQGLNSQKYWDIDRAVREHVIIRDQLQQCLRMILKLTGNPLDHQLQENSDLKLLSRKLRAHLDLRPGKIEVLTTRSMVQTRPEIITLVEIPKASGGGWAVYSGKVQSASVRPESAIKHSENLLELLSWMVVNDLYRKEINLQLQTQNSFFTVNDLKQLLAELYGFLTQHLHVKESELNLYAQANRQLANLLLVNWGEALPIDANPEQFVMSERSDPLSYGEKRHCFVHSVQRLSVSSWGEVTLQHYAGLEGVLNCITEVFKQNGLSITTDNLRVACLTRGRGRSIAMRIETIFSQLVQHFANKTSLSRHRYLLPAESGFCCFKLNNNVLSYYLLENNSALLQELTAVQPWFSPVIFDDYVLEQTFIPFLYRHNLADTVQIFYHQTSKHVAVYLIDEKASLFVTQHHDASPQYILQHYTTFLKTLIMQRKLPEGIAVRCYEIQRNSAGVVSCQPVAVKPRSKALDLQVKLVHDPHYGQIICCNEHRFQLADSNAYQAVREYIMSYRKQHEDYSFHITGIDVPVTILGVENSEQLQSVHFLNYKQKTEEKLNI
jgi:adenylate cyclase class 1